MSMARRQARQDHQERRCAEQSARCHVVEVCRAVQARDVPVADVTRRLGASERTVRRWREGCTASPPALRGRPPRCATRRQRNEVYRFLHQRGTSTPLAAVRAAFPQLCRAELNEIMHRFRRIQQRKAQRQRSRLEWLQPGTVWAADFQERREPIEGRYGWILSIKDLASRYQLVWLPLTEATAEAVQAMYSRLFAEHGPPLVMKSDNGGPFRAEGTKTLLAEHQVVPLFSPKRHPQYNGGVERANGQMAGYQEAVAEFRGRPAGPTCEDAETARRLANELARPAGWQGPTAEKLWACRQPISDAQRGAFRATVDRHRAEIRAAWEFPPDEALDHDQASAIDRRTIRDALVGHDLLRIHPRREKRGSKTQMPAPQPATIAPDAAIMQPVTKLTAPPTVGGALDRLPHVAAEVQQPCEEAQLLHHKNDC
jgi:transposase InsO family protein